jgi:NAD(P)-dependent dehydrogenase (short-subunit alcohol dehydrogenase family)
MGRLQDRTIVVTGAASGIGRASALMFAGEGARVVVGDVAEGGLQETFQMIKGAGGEALAQVVDAGDEASVQSLITKAVETYGSLDGFYANAGISGGPDPLTETTVENFQKVLQVNLIGPFLAIKHSAPIMAKQGKGAIVCTASVAGLRAGAGGTAYSASKAGVINLVAHSAWQLSGTGIRVNGICPGLIETGMTKPVFDFARSRGSEGKIGQLNPTRRYGNPEEIASVALFLLSDDASYVDGQVIPTCGGLSASLPVVPPKIG